METDCRECVEMKEEYNRSIAKHIHICHVSWWDTADDEEDGLVLERLPDYYHLFPYGEVVACPICMVRDVESNGQRVIDNIVHNMGAVASDQLSLEAAYGRTDDPDRKPTIGRDTYSTLVAAYHGAVEMLVNGRNQQT